MFNDDPFDIEQVEPILFNDVNAYLDFCRKKYFDVCTGVSVLEIGANLGYHSKKIREHNPAQLTVIEGDVLCLQQLEEIRAIDKIIIDDAIMALKYEQSFDVVICLGVLYHLHSPIHLLELIVNHCNPSVVILDCVMAPSSLQVLPEFPNHSGQNQTRANWKSACVNLVVPFLTYLQVMDMLDYECHQVHRIEVENYFPKANSWMATWRRKNDRSQNRNTQPILDPATG